MSIGFDIKNTVGGMETSFLQGLPIDINLGKVATNNILIFNGAKWSYGTAPVGLTGPIGPTGSYGSNGFSGNTGPNGQTGNIGPSGLIGYTGAIGFAGTIGSIGYNGYTGGIGEAGVTGASYLQNAYSGGNTILTSSNIPVNISNTGSNNEVLSLTQNNTTDNPQVLTISNTTSGDSVNVNINEFVVSHSGYVGVGIALPEQTIHAVAEGAKNSLIFLDRVSNNAGGVGFVGRHAKGTIGAETAVVTDDTLVCFAGKGYDGTAYSGNSNGLMCIKAAENYTVANHGTYFGFETTDNGSIARTEKMRLKNDGTLSVTQNNNVPALEVNQNGIARGISLQGILALSTAGNRVRIAEGGPSATMGYGSLPGGGGGPLFVNTTAVTANSRILITSYRNFPGPGTVGFQYILNIVPGVSFTVISTDASDRSGIFWLILEPN